MRHEIQGGRGYYKKYKKKSMDILKFRKPYLDHAQGTLKKVADRVKERVGKDKEITFVGVHNRRTDYLEFRKKRLGLENLYEDYFQVGVSIKI